MSTNSVFHKVCPRFSDYRVSLHNAKGWHSIEHRIVNHADDVARNAYGNYKLRVCNLATNHELFFDLGDMFSDSGD